MDNLRLEHPASFSTHSQVGGIHHHLLPFTPPSIEFSPQLNRPSAQQNSIPLCSSSWASLLTEPRYPQNPSSPDRAIRAWDVAPNSILQEKHGHPIDISTEIPQCAGSSLELLRGESPVLQLKQGNSLIATDFGHLRAPMNGVRGSTCNLLGENNAVNYFRKDGLHLPGLFAAEDKGDASPLSVVSGGQRASYACGADSFSGRDQRFASFVCRGGDDSQRALKECAAAVKTEMMGENSMGLAESFKGDNYEEASASDGIVLIVKKEQDAGVTIASLEDGSIGLKLGKRTYYGDVGNGEEGSRRASSSSIYCNGSGTKYGSSKNSSSVSCAATSNTANTSANTTIAATNINSVSLTTATEKHDSGGWIANKKQKGSATSAVVPICQAEGCTADLSGAKDYHRRHKVCEWHSKASKATVNNLEQRFCQQCSRFHVLSAFDEGKRSCRRRLAGHNERRRKPPPEPLPFLAPGDFAYFADGRFNGSLHEHSYFWQRRPASLIPSSIGNNAALACQLGLAGFPQQETMGNHHALDLHHYMQGLPPGGGSEVGVLDGGGTLMLGNGSALALSTVPSLPVPASASSVGLLPRISSEMAISGRALSLLSPSLGSPETMSISLGMTTPSIDQILSNTHALTASCHQLASKSNICFSSGIGMSSILHGLPHSHNHALNSLTSSSSGCTTENDQGEPPMSNFDGHSMFLVHSENSFKTIQDGENSHNGRPVLNLMQRAPEESHHHRRQPQPDLPYVDLPGLSIFNGQNIM